MKSGFITLIGKTNSGKSTLVNRLVGKKVSITSPRVQTTRDAIQGIYTDKDSQLIFVDTPGSFKKNHLLGEKMQKIFIREINDVEVILYVVDSQKMDIDEAIIKKLNKRVLFLVLNKVDLIAKENVLLITDKYQNSVAEIIAVSALSGDNCQQLINLIKKYLPEGPQYYNDNDFTNRDKKFMIKELIRETTLFCLNDELPHSVCVLVEQIEEDNDSAYIEAQIVCEKEGQKKIIIGANGAKIKKIRQSSQLKIKKLLNKQIKLELFVKVVKDWRNKERFLKDYGYSE